MQLQYSERLVSTTFLRYQAGVGGRGSGEGLIMLKTALLNRLYQAGMGIVRVNETITALILCDI